MADSSQNQKIIDGVVVLSEFDADTLPNPPADKTYLYAEDDGSGNTVLKTKNSAGTEDGFVRESDVGVSGGVAEYDDVINATLFVSAAKYGATGDGVTDDTAALQAAINAESHIYIPIGTYVINSEIIVPSNRHIKAERTAIFFKAASTTGTGECQFLRNADYAGGNTNITIEGGIWDGNNNNQTRSDGAGGFNGGSGFRFKNVSYLRLRDLTVKDPVAFSIQVGGLTHFIIENILFEQTDFQVNGDGVHVHGNSSNGVIRNIQGATSDDLVALTSDDTSVYDMGSDGPITNVTIDGVHAENGYRAVRLLSGGNLLHDIEVRDVSGSYSYAAITIGDYGLGTPNIERVLIDGVRASTTTVNEAVIYANTSVKQLIIRNVQRVQTGAFTPLEVVRLAQISGTPAIDQFILDGVQVLDSSNGGIGILTITGAITVRRAVVSNVQQVYSGSGGASAGAGISILGGAVVSELQVANYSAEACNRILRVGGSSSTLTHCDMRGVRGKNLSAAFLLEAGSVVGSFSVVGFDYSTSNAATAFDFRASLGRFTLTRARAEYPVGFSFIYANGSATVTNIDVSQLSIEYTGGSANDGSVVRVGTGSTVTHVNLSALDVKKVSRVLWANGGTLTKAVATGVKVESGANIYDIASGTLGTLKAAQHTVVSGANLVAVGSGATTTLIDLTSSEIVTVSGAVVGINAGATTGIRVQSRGVNVASSTFLSAPAGPAISVSSNDFAVDLGRLTPTTRDMAFSSGASSFAAGPYYYSGSAWVPMF